MYSIVEVLSIISKSIAKKVQTYMEWKYIFGGKVRSRFFRLVLSECGEDLKVYGKAVVYKPSLVHIGNNWALNKGAQISARGGGIS